MILATFALNSIDYNGEKLEGFSWRKIAGLAGLATAIALTIIEVEQTTFLMALYSWQIFTSVCIGLVTIPALLEGLATIKNGKSE